MDGWACRRQTHLLEEARVQTVSHELCWHVNFSARPEIGVCGSMGRYFLVRLPSEGRSEGGAPIGVLFGWNGVGKISPAAMCSDDGLASVRLCEDFNTTGV